MTERRIPLPAAHELRADVRDIIPLSLANACRLPAPS